MTAFLKTSKISQNSIFPFLFRFKEHFQQVISTDYVFVLSHVVHILYNLGLYMHLSLFLPMVSDVEPIFVK